MKNRAYIALLLALALMLTVSSGMADFLLPADTQIVGEEAFLGVTGLEGQTLRTPAGLREIQARAFANTGLFAVDLAASVQQVELSALRQNRSINHIIVRGADTRIVSGGGNVNGSDLETIASAYIAPANSWIAANVRADAFYPLESIVEHDGMFYSLDRAAGKAALVCAVDRIQAETVTIPHYVDGCVVRTGNMYAFKGCDVDLVRLPDSCNMNVENVSNVETYPTYPISIYCDTVDANVSRGDTIEMYAYLYAIDELDPTLDFDSFSVIVDEDVVTIDAVEELRRFDDQAFYKVTLTFTGLPAMDEETGLRPVELTAVADGVERYSDSTTFNVFAGPRPVLNMPGRMLSDNNAGWTPMSGTATLSFTGDLPEGAQVATRWYTSDPEALTVTPAADGMSAVVAAAQEVSPTEYAESERSIRVFCETTVNGETTTASVVVNLVHPYTKLKVRDNWSNDIRGGTIYVERGGHTWMSVGYSGEYTSSSGTILSVSDDPMIALLDSDYRLHGVGVGETDIHLTLYLNNDFDHPVDQAVIHAVCTQGEDGCRTTNMPGEIVMHVGETYTLPEVNEPDAVWIGNEDIGWFYGTANLSISGREITALSSGSVVLQANHTCQYRDENGNISEGNLRWRIQVTVLPEEQPEIYLANENGEYISDLYLALDQPVRVRLMSSDLDDLALSWRIDERNFGTIGMELTPLMDGQCEIVIHPGDMQDKYERFETMRNLMRGYAVISCRYYDAETTSYLGEKRLIVRGATESIDPSWAETPMYVVGAGRYCDDIEIGDARHIFDHMTGNGEPSRYSYMYTSANEQIATVSEKGWITGVSYGVTDITCVVTDTKTGNSEQIVCQMYVGIPRPDAVSATPEQQNVGATFEEMGDWGTYVTAYLQPFGATAEYKWVSSDPEIFNVTSSYCDTTASRVYCNGQGTKTGTAIVTGTVDGHPELTLSFTVTVYELTVELLGAEKNENGEYVLHPNHNYTLQAMLNGQVLTEDDPILEYMSIRGSINGNPGSVDIDHLGDIAVGNYNGGWGWVYMEVSTVDGCCLTGSFEMTIAEGEQIRSDATIERDSSEYYMTYKSGAAEQQAYRYHLEGLGELADQVASAQWRLALGVWMTLTPDEDCPTAVYVTPTEDREAYSDTLLCDITLTNGVTLTFSTGVFVKRYTPPFFYNMPDVWQANSCNGGDFVPVNVNYSSQNKLNYVVRTWSDDPDIAYQFANLLFAGFAGETVVHYALYDQNDLTGTPVARHDMTVRVEGLEGTYLTVADECTVQVGETFRLPVDTDASYEAIGINDSFGVWRAYDQTAGRYTNLMYAEHVGDWVVTVGIRNMWASYRNVIVHVMGDEVPSAIGFRDENGTALSGVCDSALGRHMSVYGVFPEGTDMSTVSWSAGRSTRVMADNAGVIIETTDTYGCGYIKVQAMVSGEWESAALSIRPREQFAELTSVTDNSTDQIRRRAVGDVDLAMHSLSITENQPGEYWICMTSDDPAVATVDSEGRVCIVGAGVANVFIDLMMADGQDERMLQRITRTYYVDVEQPEVTRFESLSMSGCGDYPIGSRIYLSELQAFPYGAQPEIEVTTDRPDLIGDFTVNWYQADRATIEARILGRGVARMTFTPVGHSELAKSMTIVNGEIAPAVAQTLAIDAQGRYILQPNTTYQLMITTVDGEPVSDDEFDHIEYYLRDSNGYEYTEIHSEYMEGVDIRIDGSSLIVGNCEGNETEEITMYANCFITNDRACCFTMNGSFVVATGE